MDVRHLGGHSDWHDRERTKVRLEIRVEQVRLMSAERKSNLKKKR
jgi:hypothetical protein